MKNGLDDTDFWLKKLREYKVSSMAALEHLEQDEDICSKLVEEAEYVEKKAIKKLLKIDELEKTKKEKELKANKEEEEKEAKLKEAKKKKIEKADKLRDKTMEATSKAKKEHDERIQKIENNVHGRLNISPETWTASSNESKNLLKAQEAHLTESGKVQIRKNLEEKKLLQKVSGGRALQGIFLAKKMELMDRQQLVELPDEVYITGASRCENITQSFSSVQAEHEFNKKVDIFGVGVSVTGTGGYGGLSVTVGGSFRKREEKETTEEHHKKKTYSSTVKLSNMHVGSYSFRKNQLKLSEDAKSDLTILLKIFANYGRSLNSNVIEACNRFFHNYGSHFDLGPLHFGGRFSWTCKSEGFDENKRETVKQMQTFAISASIGVSFAGAFGASVKVDYEKIKGQFDGKEISNTIVTTQLEVKITGGPPEVTDISQWKSGLVTNNSTWILTGREENFIPVWDIIENSHKEEFGQLGEVLRMSWKKITGLPIEEHLLDFAHVIRQVGGWMGDKEPTPQRNEKRLEQLLQVKQADPDSWMKYLQLPLLQEFFQLQRRLELKFYESDHIHFLMKQLVEQKELSIQSASFQDIEQLKNWLYKYEISDFSSFIEYLEKILDQAQLLDREVSYSVLTKRVEKGIQHLRLHYNDTYEDIFITILLFPYLSSNLIELKQISLICLKKLINSFLEETKKLQNHKKNILHLQCYLLLLAVDASYLSRKFQTFMRHICQLLAKLNPSIEEEFMQDIYWHLNLSLVAKLKEILSTLMQSPEEKYQRPSYFPTNDDDLLSALQRETGEREYYENDNEIDWRNSESLTIMDTMGFSKHYPNKFTLRDGLCIKSESLRLSLSDIYISDPQKLPDLVLHKLMSCDSKCRSVLMETDREGPQNLLQLTDGGEDYDGRIHPVDCLLALFLCSDDFLCQELYSKLAKCQLAVPFLFCDPMTKQLTLPHWAMQYITLPLKLTQEGGATVNQPLLSYPMPIISCIRIGEHYNHDPSKSKILNEIISQSGEYNFFFHRWCDGGNLRYVLGEGLVDMFWYLPQGSESDSFSKTVLFLNLHGNATNYPEQCRFLSQISSMCIAFLTDDELKLDNKSIKRFNSSQGGFIFLSESDHLLDILKVNYPEATSIKLSKNEANEFTNTKSSIQEAIRSRLPYIKHPKSIEHSLEDKFASKNAVYETGMTYANELKGLISGSLRKDAFPLQGEDLWKSWVAADREVHLQTHREGVLIQQYSETVEAEKAAIRYGQLKYVQKLNPAISKFIKRLLEIKNSSTTKMYFLEYLKRQLALSVSQIQHEYENSSCLLQTGSTVDNSKELLKELEFLQWSMNNTIGLEHFFREIGQVYEAAVESKKYEDDLLSRLPQAAAELLIDGYPLELMDGDSSHVPLQWVTAVLNEAVKKLNDPKVFVLSALGLQGTDKSTMLNVTFGIAGVYENTRGAFMQLLPLDEEIRSKTQCSHILIVDTEGLRPSESAQSHCNELATFAIGLANATLININGDTSEAMDNYLQVSIHAFLRMTKVRYCPSCLFIHHNPPKNNASKDLIEKLNQFALKAAKEEYSEGLYNSFSDIIKFNPEKDVFYFPELKSPMTAISQSYSKASQKLKQRCIEVVGISASRDDLRLSSFQAKLSNLWNISLEIAFVFGFKNTHEISTYNILERVYSEWEWTFYKSIRRWKEKTESEINAAPVDDISQVKAQKRKELETGVTNFRKSLKKELDAKYYEECMKVQWEKRFNKRLDKSLDELQVQARLCIEEWCQYKVFEKERRRNEKYFMFRVSQYAERKMQMQEEIYQCIKESKIDKLKEVILRRNLLNDQRLAEIETVHGFSLKDIRSHVKDYETKPLEVILNKLFMKKDKAFPLDEMKIILVTMTEKDYIRDFENIWIDIMNQFPVPINAPQKMLNVKFEVEKVLGSFVERKGLHLVAQLRRRSLLEWGSDFSQVHSNPKEKEHYMIVRKASLLYPDVKERESDPGLYARRLTMNIFSEVKSYLQTVASLNTDFSSFFVRELLELVDSILNSELRNLANHVRFTPEYRLSIYLIACGYAIPEFELIAKLYEERRNPVRHLEKHKKSIYFTSFKRHYEQARNECSIAENICDKINRELKTHIEKNLGYEFVKEMDIPSKLKFKVKTLVDLFNDDRAIDYIKDPLAYLKQKIKNYFIECCNEKLPSGCTRLQKLVQDLIDKFIEEIHCVVLSINESSLENFLKNLCDGINSICSEIITYKSLLGGYNSSQLLDPDFQSKIANGILMLRDRLVKSFEDIKCEKAMQCWKKQPHELLESLLGCTEQCPLCGELCNLETKHEGLHQTQLHCYTGWRNIGVDKVDVITICPIFVKNKEYFYIGENRHTGDQFSATFPQWCIPPEDNGPKFLYWRTFVSKRQSELRKCNIHLPNQIKDLRCSRIEELLKFLISSEPSKFAVKEP